MQHFQVKNCAIYNLNSLNNNKNLKFIPLAVYEKKTLAKHPRNDGVEIDTEVSLNRLEIDRTGVQIVAFITAKTS